MPDFEGEVVSITLASEEGAPTFQVDEVNAEPGKGLEGDRYYKEGGTFRRKRDEGREVTLIEAEAIDAVQRDYGIKLEQGATRRNIETRGVALNHLVEREFTIGEVRLRGADLCDPCGLMESRTQPGAKEALTHRGGLTAEILSGGVIRKGDRIRPAAPG